MALSEPRRVIGRTTQESIQAGLVHGYLGAIHTLVERAREEAGTMLPVYATGGDALNLREHLPFLSGTEPHLTLIGLRQIFGVNHNCPLTIQRD